MKKIRILSISLIICLYILISYLINKPYLLPTIDEIINALISILSNNFITIVFTTILRCLIGVLISFILALILSMFAFKYEVFKEFFIPIYTILKTIPNITYIIIAILWLGRNGSIILICSTIIFPIFYNTFINAYNHIPNELIDYTRTQEGSYFNKWVKVYLPLIKNELLVSISNCLTLAFKVSIMAEMIGQTKIGIGNELYFAKSNFLMPEIFAWTIIIILISYLFELILNTIIRKGSKS